jgi:2TM domain
MPSNTVTNVEKDNAFFKVAKKRAAFKYNLLSFILVNIFIWLLWLVYFKNSSNNLMPWPLWPMLMWGTAILYTYLKAYFAKTWLPKKQYQKLKFKQQ